MYEKDLSISVLLDFYGEVLTEKQREVLRMYYDDDLSLAEIAQQAEITRQGVRDSIKRGEATLREMEQKLKLVARSAETQKIIENINNAAAQIHDINQRYRFSSEIGELAEQIQKYADSLCD
jgi:predicted DNA-binding protein YlxM (UPF0122 family)